MKTGVISCGNLTAVNIVCPAVDAFKRKRQIDEALVVFGAWNFQYLIVNVFFDSVLREPLQDIHFLL
jgi:hypothetical protein